MPVNVRGHRRNTIESSRTESPQIFQVRSSSGDKYYTVDLARPHCDCVGFRFRQHCRHIEEARRMADDAIPIQTSAKEQQAIERLRLGSVPHGEFITEFGENVYYSLLQRNIIFESRGYIRLV